MLTKDEALNAIEVVAQLRLRALSIVNEAPYWQYIYEQDWARVTIDGDEATLLHCKAETSYDSPVFEVETVKFPSALLFISSDDLSKWKALQMDVYKQKQEQDKAARRQQEEATERAAYLKLKAKFESDKS